MSTSTARSEIEETLTRIKSHKGVEGILIMNKVTGMIIKSTLTEDQSKTHASFISSLSERFDLMIPTLEEEENDDELQFLRIRTRKKEIMVATEGEFLLVVIQNPNAVE
jgi:dynein light chain roadblock-type